MTDSGSEFLHKAERRCDCKTSVIEQHNVKASKPLHFTKRPEQIKIGYTENFHLKGQCGTQDDPYCAVKNDLSECCAFGPRPYVSDVWNSVQADHRSDKKVDNEDDFNENSCCSQRRQGCDAQSVGSVFAVSRQ